MERTLRDNVKDKIITNMLTPFSTRTVGSGTLVVDEISLSILKSSINLHVLNDFGLFLVEDISSKQELQVASHDLYFLSPTSLEALLVDLSHKSIHQTIDLYWTSRLSDAGRKKVEEARPRPQIMIEMDMHFCVPEHHVFNMEIISSSSLTNQNELYHPLSSDKPKQMQYFRQVASQLVDLCATLHEYPYIQYSSQHINTKTVGHLFQDAMNAYIGQHASFDYTSSRGTLVIVDRSLDYKSPLLHELTYQAMVHDLFPVEDGYSISYPAETKQGIVMKQAVLGEEDALWTRHRHSHIVHVVNELQKEYKKLSSSTNENESVDELRKRFLEHGQHQRHVKQLEQHMDLAKEVMGNSINLLEIFELEQTLASGVDEDYKKTSTSSLVKQVETACTQSSDSFIKTRLIALLLLIQV